MPAPLSRVSAAAPGSKRPSSFRRFSRLPPCGASPAVHPRPSSRALLRLLALPTPACRSSTLRPCGRRAARRPSLRMGEDSHDRELPAPRWKNRVGCLERSVQIFGAGSCRRWARQRRSAWEQYLFDASPVMLEFLQHVGANICSRPRGSPIKPIDRAFQGKLGRGSASSRRGQRLQRTTLKQEPHGAGDGTATTMLADDPKCYATAVNSSLGLLARLDSRTTSSKSETKSTGASAPTS